MKKNNKKSILLIIILTIVTLAVSVGGTYAYFQASISQGVNSRVSITAVDGITLSFNNGTSEFNFDKVLPGASWNKEISVTLTNKRKFLETTYYSIKLHVNYNGFNQSTGYLQYALSGSGETVPATDITEQSGDVTILKNKEIKGTTTADSITQTYTLTISYPNNTTSVQSQGGTFDGYIYITTGKEESLISFTVEDVGTLKALPGMTWEEWVGSEFNDVNAVIKNGTIVCIDWMGFYSYFNPGDVLPRDETIVPGYSYARNPMANCMF